MNISVVGIDRTNHNYKKIEGFINTFSVNNKVTHYKSMLHIRNNSDLLFAEPDSLDINFNLFKYVVIWINLDIEKMIELSNKYKNVKFILAVKSPIHIESIVVDYIDKNGFNYQYNGLEGINIKKSFDIINNSDKIDDNTFKINDNLYYMYLPCCLSEKNVNELSIEYDIIYFGTIDNRPNIIKIINNFKNKYNLITNNTVGFKNPEEVYNYYSKSIVCIHEQVHPVIIEYPVRFGESSSNGCVFFSIEDIKLNGKIKNMELPYYYDFNNIDDMISKIDEYLSINKEILLKNKINNSLSFNLTYENIFMKIKKIFNI